VPDLGNSMAVCSGYGLCAVASGMSDRECGDAICFPHVLVKALAPRGPVLSVNVV
jgi:hypothetical protein